MGLNLITPVGLSENLVNKFTNKLSVTSKLTDGDILQILKESHENLIDFLSACLKDQNYLDQHVDLAKKLLKRADKFFIKQKFSDEQRINILTIIKSSEFALACAPSLKIKRDDEKILLNRMCAVAHSTVFQTQTFGKLKKARSKVKADGISPESLNIITDFLKLGTLPQLVDTKTIQEVMEKADEWEIESLLKKLPEHCQITPDNALTIYQTAHVHFQEELKNKAFRFLTNQEFDFDEFVELQKNALSEKLPELALLCLDCFFYLLAESESEIREKIKETSFQEDQFIYTALQILSDHLSFSKEHLVILSASQMFTLLELLPEKFRALDLSVYTDKEVESLAQHLSPNIVDLRLSGLAISPETMRALILRCPLLEIIDLSNTVIWNTENPEKIGEVDWISAAQFEHLTEIDVTNCPDALPFIEQMIIQSPNLEVLKMQMPGFTDKEEQEELLQSNDRCAAYLGKCCPKLKTLEMTYLSSNGINCLYSNNEIRNNLTSLSFTGLRKPQCPNRFDLSSMGTKFPNLERLRLTNIFYDDEAFEKFGNSLKQLKELELSVTEPYKYDVLLHLASNCPNLRKITVWGDVSNESFEKLINNCPHLTSLKLNNIDSYRLDLLIKSNLNLEEFYFLRYNFPNPGWIDQKVLLDFASRFPNLKYLHFPFFNKEISEKAFNIAFSKMNQLKKLTVYVNENSEKLLKSLKNCRHLEYLTIRSQHDSFLSENISELSELKQLKNLSCKLICKAEDVSRLIKELPNLKKILFFSIDGSIDPIIDEITLTNPRLNNIYLMSKEKYKTDSLLKLIKNTNLKKLTLPRNNSISKKVINAVKNLLLTQHPHLMSFEIGYRPSNSYRIESDYKLTRKKHSWEIQPYKPSLFNLSFWV